MPALGPFQCKDDHLMALARKVQTLNQMVGDYGTDQTGHTKYTPDFIACLDDLQALSNLSLSDPYAHSAHPETDPHY